MRAINTTSHYKPGETLLWLHKVNGIAGKEYKREFVVFVCGDRDWSTIQDDTKQRRAVPTVELRRPV